ncbi:WD domain G-beta repeat family protein [Babesia bovis T2Bo]|uniref:WD domain G-beta repeat family protein n=1 Tax=Babesia bovis T2Bo TaxID=484906 RepID=UPI001C3598A2|nr:WD domain G-beta repeat family protein [Babesia bovis T2Bo]EDO07837.2 WD domain G-beta repeat family protein [Babesia bovis T2Bo]
MGVGSPDDFGVQRNHGAPPELHTSPLALAPRTNMKHKANDEKLQVLFDNYTNEFQRMVEWALSSLNRSREELLDVCFVVYLEVYVRLFRSSADYARKFLKEFLSLFEYKFGHFIKPIMDFLFPDQLANSPLIRQRAFLQQKYYIILSKRAMRLITGWMNNNEGSVLDDIIIEGVEFLDGELFNHSQGHLFRSHFIAKYDIDPITVNRYKHPFYGLYIRDFDDEIKAKKVKQAEVLAKQEIPYIPLGLPAEILADYSTTECGSAIVETITGEHARLEEPDKLVPLPKHGTDYYQALRGMFIAQRDARVPHDNTMALSYTFQNVLRSSSCAISAFDGRFAALGLDDGGILVWDLVTSECANAMKDITPVLGESIAARSVAKSAGATIVDRLLQNNSSSGTTRSTEQQKDNLVSGEGIMYGHDGSVQSLVFGECGKVLLSGGVDGETRLWLMGSKSTRCVYRGGDSAVMDLAYAPYGFYFSTCEADGAARMWATDRSFPLRILRTAQADCLGVKFHPNSSLLATPCSDGKIRFWDLRTSGCSIILDSTPNGVKYNPCCNSVIAISKNGRILASANGNHVTVYDLYQSRQMQMLLGHTETIVAMDFNNGTTELAISDPTVVSLWDLNCSRQWPSSQHPSDSTSTFNSRVSTLTQFENGAIGLKKAMRVVDTQIRDIGYTPENVLLTLGLSTSKEMDM